MFIHRFHRFTQISNGNRLPATESFLRPATDYYFLIAKYANHPARPSAATKTSSREDAKSAKNGGWVTKKAEDTRT